VRYNLNISGQGYKLINASIINFICSLTASEGDYEDVINELEDLLLKIKIQKKEQLNVKVKHDWGVKNGSI
tara:strand:- start:166 stop:378 length:213 start_codon:yes stop_codon:yes gene_type:complete